MLNNLKNNILVLSLVSLLIIILQHGEINRDGILYLTQAKFITEQSWDKALSLYNWPFFSLLISGLHHLTGLSLQVAAHVTNVILFLLASLFFLKTVSLLSENKNSTFLATLILLTSIPVMDDYLGMVLRDHGQWAGFMMGVYGYFRWVQSPSWAWALFWQGAFIFGALFRPECLIFNILLPVTHQLFLIKNNRIKMLIQSTGIFIVGFVFLLFAWVIFNIQIDSIDFGRLNEIVSRPAKFLKTVLSPLPIYTNNYYLKVLITDYATSFKYFFLTYVVVYKWLAGVGLLHLVLFWYAIKQRLLTSQNAKVLAVFFLLSSIITVVNLYTTYVIANRYWVLNFWIVYIVAAIGLDHLWKSLQEFKSGIKIWIKRGLVAVLAIYFLNIIVDKPRLHFEQEAGYWIKQSRIDLNNVYFSSHRAAFYAGLLGANEVDFNEAMSVIQYQYLVITYNRFDDKQIIPNYREIQHFPSSNNPKVIIYRRIDDSLQ